MKKLLTLTQLAALLLGACEKEERQTATQGQTLTFKNDEKSLLL